MQLSVVQRVLTWRPFLAWPACYLITYVWPLLTLLCNILHFVEYIIISVALLKYHVFQKSWLMVVSVGAQLTVNLTHVHIPGRKPTYSYLAALSASKLGFGTRPTRMISEIHRS